MLNILFFICVSLLAAGCDQKPQVRQFTEVVIEAPQAPRQASEDPHAGMDLAGAAGAGQADPHAGLDMAGAGMGQEDPHAGLDMSGAGSAGPQMPAIMGNRDPHAGLDMSSGAPMMAPADESKNRFAWTVPQGWSEEPGQGMRVATFHSDSNPKAVDVSIVALGGMAGGLEANLKRWLGQIGVSVPDDQLQKFIKSSQDNIFDFTQLQKGSDATSKSMIAAVLLIDQNTTVFVKMAGSIQDVTQEKENFIKLVQSVHAK